jgi:acetyl esterase
MTESERQFLREFEAFLANPPSSIQETRERIDLMAERREKIAGTQAPKLAAYYERVELRTALTADIAIPNGRGPFPVLLYLHGGGWVAGSRVSHRRLGQRFAEAGYLTINLGYRLAPEHPFPAGFDDCMFAAKWARENVSQWNGDSSRMAIGGDSSGGNLAAAVIVTPGSPRFSAALLIYGIYDFVQTVERGAMGIGPVAQMYLANQYPGAVGIPVDTRLSPLLAVKPGVFPPSIILVGTRDPLLPESEALAAALKKAGTPHELHIVKNMMHGYITLDMLPEAKESFTRMCNFLNMNVRES